MMLVAAVVVTAFAFAQNAIKASAKVGESAPDFALVASNGKTVKLSDYKGKYVVLEWTNHLCPVVVGHYQSNKMQKAQQWAKEKDVVWLGIVSSAPGKQGHVTASEANEIMKSKGHVVAAMLLDESGAVGRMYGAKTTPHMFVIDPKGTLIYNGAIDGDKVDNYVIQALTESMSGSAVSVPTTQPYGCSVKY